MPENLEDIEAPLYPAAGAYKTCQPTFSPAQLSSSQGRVHKTGITAVNQKLDHDKRSSQASQLGSTSYRVLFHVPGKQANRAGSGESF
jgi:hypothetical protein